MWNYVQRLNTHLAIPDYISIATKPTISWLLAWMFFFYQNDLTQMLSKNLARRK